MKTTNKIAILATLVAALTIGAGTVLTRKHEVIIVRLQAYGYQSQAGFQWLGYQVAYSSSSSNAPALPNVNQSWPLPNNLILPAAEHLAQLRNDGWRITHTSDDGLTLRLEKW